MDWLMGKARGVSRGFINVASSPSSSNHGLFTNPARPNIRSCRSNTSNVQQRQTQEILAFQRITSTAFMPVAFNLERNISLPTSLDRNEWLAMHIIGFLDNVSTLWDSFSDYCDCVHMYGPCPYVFTVELDVGSSMMKLSLHAAWLVEHVTSYSVEGHGKGGKNCVKGHGNSNSGSCSTGGGAGAGGGGSIVGNNVVGSSIACNEANMTSCSVPGKSHVTLLSFASNNNPLQRSSSPDQTGHMMATSSVNSSPPSSTSINKEVGSTTFCLLARRFIDNGLVQCYTVAAKPMIFPTKQTDKFPDDFIDSANSVMRHLFHCLVHFYYQHFEDLRRLDLLVYMNTLARHFFLFTQEFQLLTHAELSMVAPLLDRILQSLDSTASDTSEKGS